MLWSIPDYDNPDFRLTPDYREAASLRYAPALYRAGSLHKVNLLPLSSGNFAAIRSGDNAIIGFFPPNTLIETIVEALPNMVNAEIAYRESLRPKRIQIEL